MTKQDLKSGEQKSQRATEREISKDQWTTFLAEFTYENRGARARLEVIGPEVGHQVQRDDRSFNGISTNTKDGEDAVWITFVFGREDRLTYGIRNVAAIRVHTPVIQSGTALEVVAHDKTRTLLELSRPEDFALTAATR